MRDPLRSSILDPIRPTLSPLLWDHPEAPEPTLKPRHARFIQKTVYAALERHGYAHPHEWLRLCLTGSLTTYQYGEDSDCDCSLFVNSQVLPEWSRAEMIGIMIGEVDGTVLPGTPYPLQDFVVGRKLSPADLYRTGLRSGYDIDAGRWIVPPEKDRSHNVEAEENGFYVYALQMADKMDRLLRYEPAKAAQFWHAIHRRRMRDQAAGRGDYSESNIVYKFLSQRGLFPRLEDLTGEHIARGESPFAVTVRTMRQDGYAEEEIEAWAAYLAAHNEADRDSGELDDVPDEQVERWYENWESDGRPRLAAWQDHFVNQIHPIADAYDALPEYDPGAAGAWQELAADSGRRADELRQRYNIQVTDDPEPYPITPTGHQAMFDDINRGHFVVSRAHSEHPIWTPEQNVNFRIVHDMLGHHPSGGGFNWQGENLACGSHFPLLAPNAQRALMTECLGQTGAAIRNGGFGPQKVGFMDQLMSPAQQAYNRGTFSAIHLDLCHRHLRHGVYTRGAGPTGKGAFATVGECAKKSSTYTT